MLNIAQGHFRKALRKNPNDPITLQHIASLLHRKAQIHRERGERSEREAVLHAASEVESLIAKCVRGGTWLGASSEILAHVFDTKRMYYGGKNNNGDSRNVSSVIGNRSFIMSSEEEKFSEKRCTSLERKTTSFSKVIGALRKMKIKSESASGDSTAL